MRLDLPLHWQFPVWLAACDLAGMAVTWDPAQASGPGADVVVGADAHAVAATGAEYPVLASTTAFGLPGPVPPAPLLDHARDAMGQPDIFLGVPGEGTWLMRGERWDGIALAAHARRLADEAGLSAAGRLLVTGSTSSHRTGLAVWAAPILLGAAAVLCPPSDADAVADEEQITATLRDRAEL